MTFHKRKEPKNRYPIATGSQE